jgi:hypothetical protein
MNHFRMPLVLAFALPVAALLCWDSGIALAQNSGQTAPAPLDFDPARPEKVEGWWTNGQELIRLEPNGAYQLWLTQDRFARPVEVGAWRRSNYIFFDLESYRAKPGTRVRVEMVKRDGVTCISREDMAPFRRAPVPPHVFGDEVLGAWVTDSDQLLILENGRYEYRRLTKASGISQHNGIWRTENRSLYLAPDSGAVAPIRLDAQKSEDGSMVLKGTYGVLRQVRPETAPPAAAAPPASPPPAGTPPATVPPTPSPSSQ